MYSRVNVHVRHSMTYSVRVRHKMNEHHSIASSNSTSQMLANCDY